MAKPLPAPVSAAVLLLQVCLADQGEVRPRGMFGGYGFYLDDKIFGLWLYDGLFLKVDAETRSSFADAGFLPFEYTNDKGTLVTMPYYRIPDAWHHPDQLMPWADLAAAAARRATGKKPRTSVKYR